MSTLAARVGCALLLAWAPLAGAADDARLGAQLRHGGNVLLIRHASTEPGLGDPAGFKLDMS